MMRAAQLTDFKHYSEILERYSLPFQEQGNWLISLTDPLAKIFSATNSEWTLCISCRVSDMQQLLSLALPIIQKFDVPFRIIKNELLHYQINGGGLGYEQVGRIVELFPNVHNAHQLSEQLLSILKGFSAPSVNAGISIGSVLYAINNGQSGALHPFKISEVHTSKKKHSKLLNKRYLPYQLIQRTFKGDTFKAINLRRLALSLCVIKQAKGFMLEDQYGRFSKDRLVWQKDVQQALSGILPVPKILDYFDQGEDSYLVMEYIEAIPIRRKVRQLRNEQEWMELSPTIRKQIIEYFLTICKLVQNIHEQGYIHRDITDGNFLINSKDKIYIIDFELSFNYIKELPDPFFITGTKGYAAPEQYRYEYPTIKEDIYSLGALLTYFLSGFTPAQLLEQPLNTLGWSERIGSPDLLQIIRQCGSREPEQRPSIDELISTITEYRQFLF